MNKPSIMPGTNKNNLPMILMILDGWGIDRPNYGNAVTLADTPNLASLTRHYPHTELHAHGKFVGLPPRQVGNSEAGHMNIGAGRLVEQDVVKITKAIDNGTFYKNSAFLGAVRHLRQMKSKLHIIGLLCDDQSPHADPRHLRALLELCRENNVSNICLHLFTDGRDSPQYASLKLVADLEKQLHNNERIVTIMGRFYGMNRKKEWLRTEQAYDALTIGKGRQAKSAQAAITESYNRGDSDEFIEPYIIECEDMLDTRVNSGDSVIFYNLRSDRARQLTKAFVQKKFNQKNPGSFVRKKTLEHLYFVAMTDFGPDLDDILTAYPSADVKNTLPVQLAGLKQLYLAESEKFAHVTYFFNGGYSGAVASEDQLMVPSPDVKSYDETPAMSSFELAKIVIDNLSKGDKGKPKYDFTLLNFAAPDMVAHTGNLEAAIKCCEAIDGLVGRICAAYLMKGGTAIITADHGNIEEMVNLRTGEIDTEHSIHAVPFILVNEALRKKRLKTDGILGDIAPTILKLLGIKKPKDMKRYSLI